MSKQTVGKRGEDGSKDTLVHEGLSVGQCKNALPRWIITLDSKQCTLPGTNMEVENGPLEDHFPLQTGGFSLPC